jgi:hypothetical protein
MKRQHLFIILLLGMLFIGSCTFYPSNTELNEEQLVDITKYDVTADFKSFNTFAIVDSISVIKNNDSSHVLTPEAQQILNRIIQNMETRGYTRVTKDENPDLAINVSVIEVTNVYYYPGWYWTYWGYYDPYYWGYPGYYYWYPYYPPVIAYYSTGTVIIDLLDLKNAPIHDNKLYLIWTAYIRALMNYNHSMEDLLENIDQCFIQTPVLRAN